jgi:hypothetical protein
VKVRCPLLGRKHEQQQYDMWLAIGSCMQAWARVEATLIVLFRDISDLPIGHSDAHLTKFRNFSERLKTINRSAQSKLANSNHLADWNLLYKHTRMLSGLRNQVAHATMMVSGDRTILQPYFLSPDEPCRPFIDDVRRAIVLFHDLAWTLDWFHDRAFPSLHRPPLQLHLNRIPDLIVQLRSNTFKVITSDVDLLARIPGPHIARAFETLPPPKSVAEGVIMDCFVDVPQLGPVRITARRTTRSSGRKTNHVWTAESAVVTP